MSLLNALLRYWAYLFHLGLSVVFLGLALIAAKAHQPLKLDMLPFPEDSMVSAVTLLSLGGFITIVLAWMRIYEFVFPLWALGMFLLLVYGFFFTSYHFAGIPGLRWVCAFLAAAFLAFIGSLMILLPRRRRRGKW